MNTEAKMNKRTRFTKAKKVALYVLKFSMKEIKAAQKVSEAKYKYALMCAMREAVLHGAAMEAGTLDA
jgi:hypothetical protein